MYPEFSNEHPYMTAMRYMSAGMSVACIPVIYAGQEAVFTTGGYVENLSSIIPPVVMLPTEDQLPRLDSILVAFSTINHARKQAMEIGALPIE